MIPKPDKSLKYQYICLLRGDRDFEKTISDYENVGWIYKGKDKGYPYKLYFEYPKTDFDIVHFAMYEDMGNIL